VATSKTLPADQRKRIIILRMIMLAMLALILFSRAGLHMPELIAGLFRSLWVLMIIGGVFRRYWPIVKIAGHTPYLRTVIPRIYMAPFVRKLIAPSPHQQRDNLAIKSTPKLAPMR
jgi:hypothetical protein